ncbi:MAG: hypothetical protein AB9903_24000 [Vulcanimicrobiota bacterium]
MTARLLWKIIPLIILVWASYANTNRLMTLYNSMKKAVMIQMTETEIRIIGKAVSSEYLYSNRLPDPDNFTQWMKNRVNPRKKRKRPVYVDCFGKNYIFSKGFNNEFTIISRGPDKKINTRDDIKVKFSTKMSDEDNSPSN